MPENPWQEIIDFLELAPDVQFVDGSIPKGFEMAREHIAQGGEMKDIVSINKDGYYVTRLGDRFRGQRHHQCNRLQCVPCTPDTFLEMRASWWDISLRNKPARKADIEKYGLKKLGVKP